MYDKMYFVNLSSLPNVRFVVHLITGFDYLFDVTLILCIPKDSNVIVNLQMMCT